MQFTTFHFIMVWLAMCLLGFPVGVQIFLTLVRIKKEHGISIAESRNNLYQLIFKGKFDGKEISPKHLKRLRILLVVWNIIMLPCLAFLFYVSFNMSDH